LAEIAAGKIDLAELGRNAARAGALRHTESAGVPAVVEFLLS
jgi:hypothetical protein